MAPLQHSALRLPQQDLERCNLFDCTVEGVSAWVADLPLGSPSRAGVLLRTATSETGLHFRRWYKHYLLYRVIN